MRKKRAFALFGAGSHAYVLNEMLDKAGFELVAVLNDEPPSAKFDLDVPIIVGREAVTAWMRAQNGPETSYAVSIGNHYGRERVERHRMLRAHAFEPETLIHETAVVSRSATIGPASQVLALAFVGVRAKLGEAVIINSRASADHECDLGDGVHLAPGVTLAGRVSIGVNSFIGAGAVVLPDVCIAANVIVGAGSIVIRDLTDPGTYIGAPAKRLR